MKRIFYVVMLAGLVFYYLCVSDDPARAFTQQWYLMFVLAYTTDQVLPLNRSYLSQLINYVEKLTP